MCSVFFYNSLNFRICLCNSRTGSKMKHIKKNSNGASLIEYGFLVGLISIASIVTVQAVGIEVQDMFSSSQSALASQAMPSVGEDASAEPAFPEGTCYEFTAGNDVWSSQGGATCYDFLTGLDTMDASGQSGPVQIKAAVDDASGGKDDLTFTSYDDWYEGGMRADLDGGSGNDTFLLTETLSASTFGFGNTALYRLGSGDDYLSYNLKSPANSSWVNVYADTGSDTVKTTCDGADAVQNLQVTTSGELAVTNVDCQISVHAQTGTTKVNADFSRSLSYNSWINQAVYVKSGVDADVSLESKNLAYSSLIFESGSSGKANVTSDNATRTTLNLSNISDAGNVSEVSFSGTAERLSLNTSYAVTSDWKISSNGGPIYWYISGIGSGFGLGIADLSKWLSMPDFDNSADSSPSANILIGNVNWNADLHLYSGATLIRTLDGRCESCSQTSTFTGASLDFDKIVIDNGSVLKEITFNASNPQFTVTEVEIKHN